MQSAHSRRIPIATAPNLRGLGGLPVAHGVVTPGLLFRSATLAELSASDGDALSDLGISHVLDLRTEHERAAAPDRLPHAMTETHLDVLGDSASDLAAHLGTVGVGADTPADERAVGVTRAIAALEHGQGEALLRRSYRDIVELPSALAAYRGMYAMLTEPDFAPTLFHCTTGKDRTGWAAASLLLLLGAHEDTVFGDYLQTNTDIVPMIEPILERAESAGIERSLLLPVLTVQESYLATALDTMRARFGSIEEYFISGLGLEHSRLELLRDRFTVSS